MKVYILNECEYGDSYVVCAYLKESDAEMSKCVREREVCGPSNDITYYITTAELL